MKLKTLLLTLCTAGLAVSFAVAASSAAVAHKPKPVVGAVAGDTTDGSTTTTTESKKGKGHAKRAECKPAKKIVVTGEFVSASTGGFAMTVKGGNKAAKPWKGKQATVLVDDKTRFNGKKSGLADLAAGDRVNVQGYACKADVAAGSLLARKVTSKAAAKPKDDDEDDDDSTTGTTETTVTTTSP